MDYFLFFILIRNLPIHSTVLGISNNLLCLLCAFFQLLGAIVLICFYHTVIPILLIFASILVISLCLCHQNSKFGFKIYYLNMIITLGILMYWLKVFILGLDIIVFEFKKKNYYRVLEDTVLVYFLSGLLIVFCILYTFIILTYSNELLFEEIKRREELRNMEEREEKMKDRKNTHLNIKRKSDISIVSSTSDKSENSDNEIDSIYNKNKVQNSLNNTEKYDDVGKSVSQESPDTTLINNGNVNVDLLGLSNIENGYSKRKYSNPKDDKNYNNSEDSDYNNIINTNNYINFNNIEKHN